MTGWIEIAAVVGAVVIIGLVAIAWGTGRRRRARSRPVEIDDQRRQVLRQIAAADYTPKRHESKGPMRKPVEAKTPEQLVQEIAYFAAVLQRTRSADRIRRAHVAIRKRERLLVASRRRIIAAAPPSITCPRCHLVSYNPSDIREQYCGFCHRFHDDPPSEVRP